MNIGSVPSLMRPSKTRMRGDRGNMMIELRENQNNEVTEMSDCMWGYKVEEPREAQVQVHLCGSGTNTKFGS